MKATINFLPYPESKPPDMANCIIIHANGFITPDMYFEGEWHHEIKWREKYGNELTMHPVIGFHIIEDGNCDFVQIDMEEDAEMLELIEN